jgi:hypothetical protein
VTSQLVQEFQDFRLLDFRWTECTCKHFCTDKQKKLSVKLHVVGCTAATEHQFNVWKAVDLLGSTVQSILKNKDNMKEVRKIASLVRTLKLVVY